MDKQIEQRMIEGLRISLGNARSVLTSMESGTRPALVGAGDFIASHYLREECHSYAGEAEKYRALTEALSAIQMVNSFIMNHEPKASPFLFAEAERGEIRRITSAEVIPKVQGALDLLLHPAPTPPLADPVQRLQSEIDDLKRRVEALEAIR